VLPKHPNPNPNPNRKMARRNVKEILDLIEVRIGKPEPDNYIIVVYTGDYHDGLKAATQAGVSEDDIFMGFDVVGPGATTKFVVGTLEKRETTGYSVHEIPGKPSGVSILTPPGFRKKMLG
jgi:hypothetical protein